MLDLIKISYELTSNVNSYLRNGNALLTVSLRKPQFLVDYTGVKVKKSMSIVLVRYSDSRTSNQ